MMALRTPDGSLLIPMRIEDGDTIGDAILEIGPDHPDYERWLPFVANEDARESIAQASVKLNPYHDERGRFAEGEGGGAGALLGEKAAKNLANQEWNAGEDVFGLNWQHNSGANIALSDYKATQYLSINNQLRGGRSDDPRIQKIDAALATHRLTRDIVVARGIGNDTISDWDAVKKGSLLRDKGYVSTSLSRAKADLIANQGAQIGGGRKGGYVVTIRVPKGSHAGYLGHGEFEVLLPRNSVFRVLKVGTRKGKRYLELEYAGQAD